MCVYLFSLYVLLGLQSNTIKCNTPVPKILRKIQTTTNHRRNQQKQSTSGDTERRRDVKKAEKAKKRQGMRESR